MVANRAIDPGQEEERDCRKGAPVEVTPEAQSLLQERSCPLQAALADGNLAKHVDRVRGDVVVVEEVGDGEAGFGALLRLFQVGNLQAYSFLFGIGIVGLIYFAVFG